MGYHWRPSRPSAPGLRSVVCHLLMLLPKRAYKSTLSSFMPFSHSSIRSCRCVNSCSARWVSVSSWAMASLWVMLTYASPILYLVASVSCSSRRTKSSRLPSTQLQRQILQVFAFRASRFNFVFQVRVDGVEPAELVDPLLILPRHLNIIITLLIKLSS